MWAPRNGTFLASTGVLIVNVCMSGVGAPKQMYIWLCIMLLLWLSTSSVYGIVLVWFGLALLINTPSSENTPPPYETFPVKHEPVLEHEESPAGGFETGPHRAAGTRIHG